MKYKLETIPVWDAFKEETECPLCFLSEKAEQRYLNFYLGNSVMNPETRVEVNKTGFCREHFSSLLKIRSNHSLGLMTHTHMEKRIKLLQTHLNPLKSEASKVSTKKSLIKSKKLSSAIKALRDHLIDHENKCMICTKIEYTIERYLYTIIHLWKTDEEFKELFMNSNGFCFHHLPELLKMGEEVLNPGKLGTFIEELIPIIEKNNERLEKDILWFTRKFDSKNFDKPWGSSEDAHYRTVQKLTGRSNNSIKK